MFDVGFWELALVGVVALIILGPERMPQVARTAGVWFGRARRYMADIKADVKREMDGAEMQSLREMKNELLDTRDSLTEAGQKLKQSVTQSESPHMMAALTQSSTGKDVKVTSAKRTTVKKKQKTKKRAVKKYRKKVLSKKIATRKKTTRKLAKGPAKTASKKKRNKKKTKNKSVATRRARS